MALYRAYVEFGYDFVFDFCFYILNIRNGYKRIRRCVIAFGENGYCGDCRYDETKPYKGDFILDIHVGNSSGK